MDLRISLRQKHHQYYHILFPLAHHTLRCCEDYLGIIPTQKPLKLELEFLPI
jgi:hypothetical protein